MTPLENTDIIKSLALRHGFMLAGMAKVQKLVDEEPRLQTWLDNNYHGDMHYMANHSELRLDPQKLVPGAKTVICLAYNYFNDEKSTGPKVAMYAKGKDYHKVLRKKLKSLWTEIRDTISKDATGRYFVDSAPVMERQWAALAGLGWTGKNTLLINPKIGSYFFLAEIICDVEVEYDSPMQDHCGTCTRCIDACPTEAIASNGYVLKANQCISYFTIESKSAIPDLYKSKLNNWLFGCDICQQVCPWNKFSKPHEEDEFIDHLHKNSWSYDDWISLTQDQFNETFSQSPIKRMGYERLQNILNIINE